MNRLSESAPEKLRTDDGPPPPPEGVSPESEGEGPESVVVFEEDRTPQRATVYWVLLVVLLAGTLLLRDSPWQSSVVVHLVMESASTLLALIVGALALVRYYSKKKETYLFIGAGFLGTAVLEIYHALVAARLVGGHWTALEVEDQTAWTWIGSRLILSLFFYVSWLSLKREQAEGEDYLPATERAVYLTTIFTTGLIVASIAFFPTTRAYYPELSVHRPAEFLPALFFGMTLVGYLVQGSWRRDPFEHWLIIALVLSTVGQAVYMPFSANLHDAAYDAAHLIKLVSYVAVLTGVMVGVFVAFRREGRVMEHVRSANTALAREVAERRRTERVLKDSEERLRDFLENAHDLIQTTTPEGVLRYVNEAWCRTLGYDRENIVGKHMSELVHPQHVDLWEDALERVVQGQPVSSSFEIGLVRADEKVILCSGSLNCRFENGKPTITRGIFRDVTSQRRAEREITHSQANLKALIESTGDTIWSVDGDHRLITFNTAFALTMEARTDREPKKGDLPEDLYRTDKVDWYREQYDRALAGERFSVTHSEEIAGEVRHLELFFNPIVEGASISGVVAFGRDVTRRVHTEEALLLAKEEAEAANRSKSHFLANMSHELRTPLNSVIGFTNILLKDKERNLDRKQMTFLERILTNGRHLLELINDVLDLAKVESGRMDLEIAPIDLDELVNETVAQLEGQVRAQKGDRVQLRAEVPDTIRPLSTDSAKLKQVIINLVGNALKFTDEGEVAVIVEADERGERARSIHVKDTGIGIPDDRLEAIFEAFQQADSSTSRRYGGTGLGLSISKSICQMLGYDLGVSSVVGEGSTFSIHLGSGRARIPRVTSDAEDGNGAEAGAAETDVAEADALEVDAAEVDAAEDVEEAEPAPKDRSTARATEDFEVLVIDDSPDAQLLMRHYLEDFGCKVSLAASGEEGLAMARRDRPDLITLDLVMSGIGGWNTLQELKNDPDLRHIPVVVVSIKASEDRGRLLGAMDLVNKPVQREDLLRVLWRNLPRRQGSRVLVVDDDPAARTLYRSILEEVGLEVVQAENGSEALHLVGLESPDAIILDLMMPVMDGMTFLEKLREMREYIGIPVIVVTAKELGEQERELLEKKASTVLSKVEDDVKSVLKFSLERILRLDEPRSARPEEEGATPST